MLQLYFFLPDHLKAQFGGVEVSGSAGFRVEGSGAWSSEFRVAGKTWALWSAIVRVCGLTLKRFTRLL